MTPTQVLALCFQKALAAPSWLGSPSCRWGVPSAHAGILHTSPEPDCPRLCLAHGPELGAPLLRGRSCGTSMRYS